MLTASLQERFFTFPLLFFFSRISMDCCSQICNLVTDSLLPFIELKDSQITKEKEKEMLLSLSMVSRKIMEWGKKHNSLLEENMVEHCHNCSQKYEYNCLPNVVTILVTFLRSANQFIQHITGHILSSLCSFLSRYVNRWVEYIQMLLITLEEAMPGSCSSSLALSSSLLLQPDNTCFDFGKFIALLRERLEDVNWQVATPLFQILRNILKSLKLDNSVLESVFKNLVFHALMRIPWDLLHNIDTGNVNSFGVLLGNALQIFCSLVEKDDIEEKNALALHKIIDLVPHLLCCSSGCFGGIDKRLSQYIRHKMLILMYRLSFYDQFSSPHPASWIKLLRTHFQDLLFKPFSSNENCLEDSPFFVGTIDGVACTPHLQRLGIYLYFKCCFKVVHEETGCNYQMVVLELTDWLETCGVLKRLMSCENYSEPCRSFALSFLQLYIPEDDMLFSMLLLLLEATYFSLQEPITETCKYSKGINALLFVRRIFDAALVFQLFLYLLHYDHLVLIDYLISKDTGVQCAQYLLRCLRIICKSWHIFVEFSICSSKADLSSYKRRKLVLESSCQNGWETSYENAKQCLLSLKKAVADLHKKQLFPYNPKPLLRSLTRFEELSEQ